MHDQSPSDLLRQYLVGDVMTRSVFTARPDETLLAAARTMRAHHVSGLPVVRPKGTVVGVLSEKDIVRILDRALGIARARGILDLILAAQEPNPRDVLHRSIDELTEVVVKKAMTSPAVTVEEDAPLGEAERLIRQYSVNRLPVLRQEQLAGIVTREDILDVLNGERPHERPRRRYARGRRAAP